MSDSAAGRQWDIGALPNVFLSLDFEGIGVPSKVDGTPYSSYLAADRTDA